MEAVSGWLDDNQQFAEIAAADQQPQIFDLFRHPLPQKAKPLIFSRKIRGSSLQNWWSRGDLNPRPPVLRCRYYMLSQIY